jgi:hypothetical protein
LTKNPFFSSYQAYKGSVTFSDVSLVLPDSSESVSGGFFTMPAHRIVLSSCSEYFKRLFDDETKVWIESSSKEITLHDLNSLQLDALLEYAYSNTCSLQAGRFMDALCLIQVASRFSMKSWVLLLSYRIVSDLEARSSLPEDYVQVFQHAKELADLVSPLGLYATKKMLKILDTLTKEASEFHLVEILNYLNGLNVI